MNAFTAGSHLLCKNFMWSEVTEERKKSAVNSGIRQLERWTKDKGTIGIYFAKQVRGNERRVGKEVIRKQVRGYGRRVGKDDFRKLQGN